MSWHYFKLIYHNFIPWQLLQIWEIGGWGFHLFLSLPCYEGRHVLVLRAAVVG